MSDNDPENPSREVPTFDLDWAFDDTVKPACVTVFSDEKTEIRSQWITIEKDYAWDLNTIA